MGVYTACVMLLVDSTRCESHPAAQDIFQPLPTQRSHSGSCTTFSMYTPHSVPKFQSAVSGIQMGISLLSVAHYYYGQHLESAY